MMKQTPAASASMIVGARSIGSMVRLAWLEVKDDGEALVWPARGLLAANCARARVVHATAPPHPRLATVSNSPRAG